MLGYVSQPGLRNSRSAAYWLHYSDTWRRARKPGGGVNTPRWRMQGSNNPRRRVPALVSRLKRLAHKRTRPTLKWFSSLTCGILLVLAAVNTRWSFGHGNADRALFLDCGCIVYSRSRYEGTPENILARKIKVPPGSTHWFLGPGAFRRTIGSFEAEMYSFQCKPHVFSTIGYGPVGNQEFVKITTDDVVVPLWVMLAAASLPTAFFWRHEFIGCLRWAHVLRMPPGYCHACRYDLTGNVSGICPECGMAVRRRLRTSSRTCIGPLETD